MKKIAFLVIAILLALMVVMAFEVRHMSPKQMNIVIAGTFVSIMLIGACAKRLGIKMPGVK